MRAPSTCRTADSATNRHGCSGCWSSHRGPRRARRCHRVERIAARPAPVRRARPGPSDEPGSSRGRWRMHDLVRAYGVAKTREDAALVTDGNAARARLLGWYQDHVTDSHPYLRPLARRSRSGRFADRQEALRWLDTEREGLVGACQWATDPEYAANGTRFALSLCHYLSWRRHFDDASVVYRHAVKGASMLGDRRLEGMAYDNLGTALRYLRRIDEAIATHQRLWSSSTQPVPYVRRAPRGTAWGSPFNPPGGTGRPPSATTGRRPFSATSSSTPRDRPVCSASEPQPSWPWATPRGRCGPVIRRQPPRILMPPGRARRQQRSCSSHRPSGTRSVDTRQILPTQHPTPKPHNDLHADTISQAF